MTGGHILLAVCIRYSMYVCMYMYDVSVLSVFDGTRSRIEVFI